MIIFDRCFDSNSRDDGNALNEGKRGVRSKYLTFHPQPNVSLPSAWAGLSDLEIRTPKILIRNPGIEEGIAEIERVADEPLQIL